MFLHHLLGSGRRTSTNRPLPTRPASQRKPAPFRPQLEGLEDRVVPAVYAVTSLADNLGPVITAGHAGTAADPFLAPSLRSAIQAANNNPGGNTIELTLPGTYKITLAPTTPNEADNLAGEFAIMPTGGDLSITNTSGGNVAVDGGGLARVFDINPNFDPNNPTPKFTVTLQGFTVQDGRAFDATGANPDGPAASGGGIRDQGNASLTLDNLVVTNNSATADGGGVSMENLVSVPWTLTVTNSIISDNHAGDAGGGLETDGSGKIFVTDSTITGNSSVNQGAGIWLDAIQSGNTFQTANLTVTNTLISDNTALAANNTGGGIGNAGNGTVTIQGSTLTGNSVDGTGGGFGDMNAQGTLVVIDSTFVGNQSIGNGGGIEAAGPSTTIQDSTITGNVALSDGGGVAVTSATFVLDNTIVAQNFANGANMNFQGTDPDVLATVTTGNGNFIGIGATGLVGITNGTDGNQIGTATAPLDPLLGPLQNNGGQTPTEVPLPGSTVIDTGVNTAIPTGLTTDQLGFNRIVNNTVDIGAVEFQPPGTTTTLVASATQLQQGQAVILTATVAGTTPGSNTPQGSVSFFNGGTPLGSATLVNGKASLTVDLPAGNDNATAIYTGGGDFASSTSGTVTVSVMAPTVTTTTVANVSQEQALFDLFFDGLQLALAPLLGGSTAALQANINSLLPVAGPLGSLFLSLGEGA
jgi:hypothetical protein